MAESDKEENGDFVAQAFCKNSPGSADDDAKMASDWEDDEEATADPEAPAVWSKEPGEGGSGGAGGEEETGDGDGDEEETGDGDGEGDELDGLPVFGVDQDLWDLDIPSLGEPYPETSNTGSEPQLIGLGEEQRQQGLDEEEQRQLGLDEEEQRQLGLDEDSQSNSHTGEGGPFIGEVAGLSRSPGLSPMAADEGMFGHPEAAAPEEDETHSSPTHTPPAEASPEDNQHQSEFPEADSQTEDAALLQPPSQRPSSGGDMEPLGLGSIKDEPIDEGYDAALQPQPSVSRIKEELDQAEELEQSCSSEQLRISAVFSVSGGPSNSAAPVPLAQQPLVPALPRVAPAPALPLVPALPPPPSLPASLLLIRCSGCSKVLQRGQTAFQRKGSNQLFCSTPCLTGATLPPAPAPPPHPPPPPTVAPPPIHHPPSPILPPPTTQKRSCSSCHKEIINMKDLIKAPVGQSVRDFCSRACLENKRHSATPPRPPTALLTAGGDIGLCSICRKVSVVEHEVNHLGVFHKLCNDRCFMRFLVVNNLTVNVCEFCGNHCSKSTGTLRLLQANDALKKFCSSECIFSYRQKRKQLVFNCAKCQTKCNASQMLEGVNQQGITELFCSNKCRLSSRVPNSLADAQFPCTHCQKVQVPQYHLATGDGAIRNFCSVQCVYAYQDKGGNSTPSSQMNGSTSTPAVTLTTQQGQPYGQQQPLAPPLPPAPQRVPHLTQMLNPMSNPLPPYIPAPLIGQASQNQVPGATHNALPHYIPAPGVPQPRDLQQQQQQRPPQQPPLPSSISTYQLPRIYCKQCSQGFNDKPQVLQHKGQVWLFCGKTCCELFKRHNSIVVVCEYCKLDRVLKDISLTFEKKLRTFCSEGCKLLFKHDLAKRLGQPCSTCTFCSNMTPKTIPNYFAGKVEEFCSEDCMSAYTVLFYEMAKCDTCKKQGRLTESLKWSDGVKHFCNQLCFVNFCLQASHQDSPRLTNGSGTNSGPRPAGLLSAPAQPSVSKATAVIGDVVSLASTPSSQPSDSQSHTALTGALPTSNGHSKIIGDASTQTDVMKLPAPASRLLKNKALMCKPIIQEQGIQCLLEPSPPPPPPPPLPTDAHKHTDDKDASSGGGDSHTQKAVEEKEEKVRLVPVPYPVPVPVFIPVPMHMYTQYTPVPLGMPIPVPVPLMVPSKPDGTGQQVAEGGPNPRTPADVEEEEVADEEDKEKDKPASVGDQGSTYSGDLESEAVSTPLSLDDDRASHPSTETRTPNPLSRGGPQDTTSGQANCGAADTHKPEDAGAPVEHRMALKHRSGKRTREGAPLRKRSRKRGASPLGGPGGSSGISRLNHTYGVQAWLSWVQWRNKQLNSASTLGKPSGARAMVVKEDVLQCSSAELSYGLCRFISEVRRPDGQPYAADAIYCLCLGIQQYLFDNGRIENIFTDCLYSKFTTDITKMLKNWGHTVEPHELLQSRVEEEYLWQCKQLGAYSPIVLLSTLLFFAAKLLRLATLAQHRRLAFAHVSRHTRTTHAGKTAYLRFRIPGLEQEPAAVLSLPTKRKLEEDDGSRESDLEMPENKENPLRCPVRLYEFYLSKCSESVKKRADLFYLQPERVCDPNSPLWYSDQPLEIPTLENLLTRIQVVRQVYTGDTDDQNQPTSTDDSS
ncbi:hypothetical protein ACEWY4_005741 [Coilia grayii]|uniref:TRASH domain-containing protein n=1 Tax=Coilia grayii TaxID=363190 RepID=A0ABD1KJU2_9TELE